VSETPRIGDQAFCDRPKGGHRIAWVEVVDDGQLEVVVREAARHGDGVEARDACRYRKSSIKGLIGLIVTAYCHPCGHTYWLDVVPPLKGTGRLHVNHEGPHDFPGVSASRRKPPRATM